MRVTSFKIMTLLAMMLAMVSCENWKVHIDTQVHRDGSCIRTVTANKGFCLTEDEGWDYTKTVTPKDSANEDNYVVVGFDENKEPIFGLDSTRRYIITREFDRVEDMGSYPALMANEQPVTSAASLTKKFKWFYTDYTFTETFNGWDSTFNIPITDYMSREEASFMWSGYPNLMEGMTGNEIAEAIDSYEEKVEMWEYTLVWDIWFQSLAEYYDYIKNPPVDRETFLSLRDSMARYAWDKDVELFQGHERGAFRDFFNTDTYFSSFEGNDEVSEELDARQEYLMNRLGAVRYLKGSYTLGMPGSIIDPGRGAVENGAVVYKFDGACLITGDYAFTATSRAANVWAFLLSGLILIIAVGSFFIKR